MIILILRSQMRSLDRLFMIMSRDVIQAAMRAAAAAARACGGLAGAGGAAKARWQFRVRLLDGERFPCVREDPTFLIYSNSPICQSFIIRHADDWK